MKPMEVVKMIVSRADENGKPEGYGVVTSDGINASIKYFDKYYRIQEQPIQYCRRAFKIYCEKNNLKQL